MNTLIRKTLRLFRLDIETGLGLASGQGEDPVARLRISRNGGHTWEPEQLQSFGKVGEYSVLVDWWQQGQARQFAYEIVITDPVPSRIAQAIIVLEEGTS